MAIAEVQRLRWTSAILSQDRALPRTPDEKQISSADNNEDCLRTPTLSRSAPVYQHSKVARFCSWKWMGLFFSGSSRGIKIRRTQEKIVGLGIDLHRLRPILGFDRLNLTELVG